MRKVMLGFILGIGLTLSFNVYAAVESLIGKQVQGEVIVKLNGADLSNKAAIVDGTSYLPVRSIGEALGLNVDFQNNEVILNQPKEVVQPVPPNTVPAAETSTIRPLTLKQIEGKIELAKQNILALKMAIEAGGGTSHSHYNENQDRIAKYEAELSDLEKQKAAIQP